MIHIHAAPPQNSLEHGTRYVLLIPLPKIGKTATIHNFSFLGRARTYFFLRYKSIAPEVKDVHGIQ